MASESTRGAQPWPLALPAMHHLDRRFLGGVAGLGAITVVGSRTAGMLDSTEMLVEQALGAMNGSGAAAGRD